MTNMMDNEGVRRILDLLEVHYERDAPEDFDLLIDEIEVIL